MSETPAPEAAAPDLTNALASAQAQDLIFVGREDAEMLLKFFVENPGEVGKVAVAMFPYSLDVNGTPTPLSSRPRRGTFIGTLLSAQITDTGKKGRFVFSDGTVIYRDNNILE